MDRAGQGEPREAAEEASRSLVETVARIISEYPDEWLWEDANASQRSHYEALARLAITAVRLADATAGKRCADAG